MLRTHFHVWWAVALVREVDCLFPFSALICKHLQSETRTSQNAPTKRQETHYTKKWWWCGMGDDKHIWIKIRIFLKLAQVGITWAQTNCNFQNLAGRKKYVRNPEIPSIKLTARISCIRVYIFWLSVSFLTNRALGSMVAEFQHTPASCPCWRPDFKTMTFRGSIFLNNHLSKWNKHNEHIMMKNDRRMYSKKMFSDENPTNTVLQLSHTQAAANLAK